MNAPKQKPDFQHQTAIAEWIFMSLWLGMIAVFTYLFIRDGGFHQFDPPIEVGIILLFWMAGLAGTSYALTKPLTYIWVRDGYVEVSEIWPFRRAFNRFPVSDISPPIIKKTSDSDGDTFTCQFHVPGGRTIVLGISNYLEDAELRVSEFTSKLRHR